MIQQTNSRKLLPGQFIKAVCCSNVLVVGCLLLLEPIAMARGNERLKHNYLINKIVSYKKDFSLDSQILKQGNKILSIKSIGYPQNSFFTYPSFYLQSSKLFSQVITKSSQVTQEENTTEAEPRVLVAEVIVRSEKGKLEDRLVNEVYQVIRTQPGRTTTRSQLQEDINAIFGTGFFSNVQAVPEDTPLGIRVSFLVQPNPVLTKVQVQANPGTGVPSVLPATTADEVFREQYGKILNLRDLQERIKQLTKRYQDQGYVLANVIGAPQVSENGVVTLQVAEGVVEEFQVRFLNENESATDEKGNPIKGVTPIKEILSTVQSKPGQIFRRYQIQKDLQLIAQLGIAEDISISLEPSKQHPGNVVVVINITNELITEWNIWTRKAKAALDAADANDYETSLKYYKELLETFRSNKLQEKEALTLNNLANLYKKFQKYQLALDTYRDSLPIFHKKAPLLEVSTLINMAEVSYQLKEPEQAIHIYKQALSRIRVLKSNPSHRNLFGSLVADFKDDFRFLALGYLTITEIGLTLDLSSTYVTKGDYQQAIYMSQNFNSNNYRNLVDVWANLVNNIANNNLQSLSLEKSEQSELLKLIPPLAQALSQTPDIYSSSIIRFAYSDLGDESKAKIYEQRSKKVTQEALANLLPYVNKETTNNYNPYIKVITNTIIFFLKDNKTEQEEQEVTQDIISLLDKISKDNQNDSDPNSKNLISTIKGFVPGLISLFTGSNQNKNTILFTESLLETLRLIEIQQSNEIDGKKIDIKKMFNIFQGTILSIQGDAYYNLGDKQKAVESYNQAINISNIDINSFKKYSTLFKQYSQNPKNFPVPQLNTLMQIMQEMQLELKLYPRERKKILIKYQDKIKDLLGSNPENTLLPSLSLAQDIYAEIVGLQTKAKSLASLGRVYTDLGKLEKARTTYYQALKLWNIADYPPDSQFRFELARLEDKLGNLFAAKIQIETAIQELENQLVNNNREKTGYAFAEYNYGYGFKDRGNILVGVRFSSKGITEGNVSSLSIPFFGPSCQTLTDYFACKQRYFDLYINLLMQLHQKYPSEGYDALAFEASERARKNTSEVFQLAPGQSLKELTNELSSNQQLLKPKNSSQRRWLLNQSVKLAEIQKLILDKDTLLLEYFLGEKNSYLWVVSVNSLKTYTLLAKNEIEAKAREFYKVLTEPDGRTSPRKTAKIGLELTENILGKEVSNQIQQKRLLIVADGILQYIPFSALPNLALIKELNGTQIEGEFAPYMQPLLVTNEIVNLPSASVLAKIRQNHSNRPTPSKGLAIFADPVFNHKDERAASLLMKAAKTVDNTNEISGITISPNAEVIYHQLLGTQKEMEKIVLQFSSQTKKLYSGFDASYENALSTDLSQYRFIHFATHGIFNNKSLERSGIVLSTFNDKGELQRGLISPTDVLKMNLSSADLVVLSGCRTGLNNVIRREALTGLTGGLMSAGAERVVVSLWSVDDEVTTAKLMERFYQKMLDSHRPLPPAQALREAQISMWKDARFQAPYHWAAFTIQGEWR